LDKRIEDLDTDLRRRLRASPAWCARDDLLRSIPGVGATTSATLLAKLPELGTLDRKGIAALAGLAPLANDVRAHESHYRDRQSPPDTR